MSTQHGANDSLSIFADTALTTRGWQRDVHLQIANGRIVRMTPNSDRNEHAVHVMTLLPGINNLHSHAFQRGIAGLTEQRGRGPDSFWTWREWMYRFVAQLSPDDMRVIAELAYAEMLESGMTRVGEFHYLHHDTKGCAFADPAEMAAQLFEAACATGIQMTLLPVYYSRGDFDAASCTPMQARFACSPDSYAELVTSVRRHATRHPGSIVGCAAHSLRAASAADIRAVATLAHDSVMHIHIAEQVREVDACVAHHGAPPVAYLLGEADVDARWCLVHATHMTPEERLAVAKSGAVVGLCPVTEANLGDGILAVDRLQHEGGTWGIGSDSNVRIDAYEELRLLEYTQRLTRRARNVLAEGALQHTGRNLYERAVMGGAQALGVDAGLAEGHWADMVSLSSRHPSLIERDGDAVLDSIVFAAGRSAIESVWARGTVCVAGGRHIHRDAIEEGFRRVLRKLVAT